MTLGTHSPPLLPFLQVEEAKEDEEKEAAMHALGLAVTEIAIIDHLFFINNPQRVRNTDHWVQNSQLPDESKRQAMIQAAVSSIPPHSPSPCPDPAQC